MRSFKEQAATKRALNNKNKSSKPQHPTIPRIVLAQTNKHKFQHTLEAETLRHNASNLCRVTYFVFHLAASALGLQGRFKK